MDDEYNSFKLTCSNEYDSLSKIINIDYITDFSIINSAPVVVLDRSGYNIKSEDDVVFLNKSNQKICLDSFDVDVYKNFPDDYEYSLYLKNDSNEIFKKNNPCLGSGCTISFENLDIEVEENDRYSAVFDYFGKQGASLDYYVGFEIKNIQGHFCNSGESMVVE
ncbi:MAG: hypothetical protein ACOX0H_03950 [Patescibacteria group bacterium]